jgi:NAD-dependent deacetylase
MLAVSRAEQALKVCDMALVIGTSAEVYPAAGLPSLVKRHGGAIVVINPNPTGHVAEADVFLQGTAKDFLPKLVTAIAQDQLVSH